MFYPVKIACYHSAQTVAQGWRLDEAWVHGSEGVRAMVQGEHLGGACSHMVRAQ